MDARAIALDLPVPIGREYLDVLEDEIFERDQRADVDDETRSAAMALEWLQYLPPHVVYRLDILDARVSAYPMPHRILPTRLGNVLRASEDVLPLNDNENLEGFVVRHLDKMPDTLKAEHRDYRVRLDMYCTLVLVFVILALAGGCSVPWLHWWEPCIAALGYAGLAYVSYEAAIASARQYGNALREIGLEVQRQRIDVDEVSTKRRLLLPTTWFHRHSV